MHRATPGGADLAGAGSDTATNACNAQQKSVCYLRTAIPLGAVCPMYDVQYARELHAVGDDDTFRAVCPS